MIGGLDPFSAALGKPVDQVPPLEASDIVSYLILQTSFFTSKQFKARKSVEAYTISLFVDGSRMSRQYLHGQCMELTSRLAV